MTSTPTPVQQVAEREIRLRTEFWEGTLSNRGAVLTEWVVTKFTDGKIIDKQTGGVHLVTKKISTEVGAPFRLVIPSAPELEKELNSAVYALEVPQASDATEISLGRDEQKDFAFAYSNTNGVLAKKTLRFNGAGYDLGVQVDVTRNGVPLETQVVVGPNFGDHSITSYSVYRPAPQASYAINTSVERDAPSDVDGSWRQDDTGEPCAVGRY